MITIFKAKYRGNLRHGPLDELNPEISNEYSKNVWNYTHNFNIVTK